MADEKQKAGSKTAPIKAAPAESAEAKDNFNYIVRIANSDLDGNKPIGSAVTKIKGVGCMFSSAICRLSGVSATKKCGYLSDSEVKKIEDIVYHPSKFNIPSWMFNRQNDPETGADMHLLSGDLQFARENDIKMMKKIKCYKGVRHIFGLPCRGQRTKSNFRKTKSRGKGSIGVKTKK